jgi:hypothetical protein
MISHSQVTYFNFFLSLPIKGEKEAKIDHFKISIFLEFLKIFSFRIIDY